MERLQIDTKVVYLLPKIVAADIGRQLDSMSVPTESNQSQSQSSMVSAISVQKSGSIVHFVVVATVPQLPTETKTKQVKCSEITHNKGISFSSFSAISTTCSCSNY